MRGIADPMRFKSVDIKMTGIRKIGGNAGDLEICRSIDSGCDSLFLDPISCSVSALFMESKFWIRPLGGGAVIDPSLSIRDREKRENMNAREIPNRSERITWTLFAREAKLKKGGLVVGHCTLFEQCAFEEWERGWKIGKFLTSL
jgi:hypothetical protein